MAKKKYEFTGDPTHPSWPADTTRWSVEPEHDFDVVEFEVI